MKRCRGVLLLLVILLLAVIQNGAQALRCRTNDGPSSEEVKKIIRMCLNKITNPQSETNRSSDEYPDYDSSYADSSEERRDRQEEMSYSKHEGRRNYESDRGGSNGRRTGGSPDQYNRQQSADNRDNRGRGDGDRMRQDRRNGRDRYEQEEQQMWRDYAGRTHNRRRRQYPAMGGSEWPYRERVTGPMPRADGGGNGSRNGSGSLERDRACLMQCFFEQLRTTGANGLPEKHKVLHVITKDIRERELREFYVDSIQECFHMLGLDSQLRDKCDYSMRLVTCLTDRFQSNCSDWDMEASAMF